MNSKNIMNPKIGLAGAVITFVLSDVIGLGIYAIIYGFIWWWLTKKAVLFIKAYLYLKILWETGDKNIALCRSNAISVLDSTDYIEEANLYAQNTFYGAQLPVIEQAKSEGFYEYRIPSKFKQ